MRRQRGLERPEDGGTKIHRIVVRRNLELKRLVQSHRKTDRSEAAAASTFGDGLDLRLQIEDIDLKERLSSDANGPDKLEIVSGGWYFPVNGERKPLPRIVQETLNVNVHLAATGTRDLPFVDPVSHRVRGSHPLH